MKNTNIQTFEERVNKAVGHITYPKLEQIIQSKIKTFIDFVQHCSDDPMIRTTSITAMTMALWQLTTRGTIYPAPSALLIRSEEEMCDPIDQLLKKLLDYKGIPRLDKKEVNQTIPTDIKFYNGTMEYAPKAMVECWKYRKQTFSSHQKIYHEAMHMHYGKGICSNYSHSWHTELGLICGDQGGCILRLDSDKDIQTLKNHIANPPSAQINPLAPQGPGAGLEIVPKTISLSGSISASDYDADTVLSILEAGMPCFFLPHSTTEPLRISNLPALEYVFRILQMESVSVFPQKPPVNHDFFNSYNDYLWERVGNLPYKVRLPIMNTFYQLSGFCHLITHFIHELDKSPITEDLRRSLSWLYHQLFMHTIRGLTLAIAGLAWHGIGFKLPCARPQLIDLLQKLRGKGSMSKRDIQREVRFESAAARDAVLSKLESEGLLKIDHNTVTAISLADFTRALHHDPRFVEVVSLDGLLHDQEEK